jgi:hypothetical protein
VECQTRRTDLDVDRGVWVLCFGFDVLSLSLVVWWWVSSFFVRHPFLFCKLDQARNGGRAESRGRNRKTGIIQTPTLDPPKKVSPWRLGRQLRFGGN